ncbi:MAG TPA: alkaline phosphatase D family protein [Lacibacter sp.]|nr:alkaline phosphatase D family protein [Lacibacter sp.]HMO88007.1 alkaline phosphatase D family protein [Lacibacter sp.]HMP87339.1 alkaline phosphatase D family protein [Lacibacter sp.]
MRPIRISLVVCLLFASVSFLHAQLVSGPMLGPVELRTARLWVEVKPGTTVDLWYWKQGELAAARRITRKTNAEQWFAPAAFDVVDLQPNTTYEYQFLFNNVLLRKPTRADGRFTTKVLWHWRQPAPDFSFLTGSCAYFNEPVYDRPGKPYGGDSSIFETMAKEKAAFMLWLGDNWYTREVDYYDHWGMWKRASRDRAMPVLQPFLKSTSHLAIWDDHDYGPNDASKDFILKETSRTVFSNYWLNTTYGMNGEGIYTLYSYGDVDVFMLDDRWWRSADNMPDSLNGQPNPNKRMWGPQQLEWLKNALLYSRAPFKIIANGSQVLNPVSPFDKLLNCPAEYQELMDFLQTHRVNGVVFLSGDRHHSEIIRLNRPGTYPLYDITVSPLTAGTHTFGGVEKNNPYRVYGLDEKQNYGRFSFTGPRGQRKMTVEFLGIKGEKLGEWSVGEQDLRTPR